MFAKSHRFSFKKGAPRNSYQALFFVIRYDRKKEEGLECSVVVGKKVDNRATVRNKIKRQTVAMIKELLDYSVGFRIAVYAKKSILDSEPEARKEDLQKAFKTIGIQ